VFTARVSCRQAASVPRTVGPIGAVAVGGKDRSYLGQRLTLGTRTAFVYRTLGQVERLDHTLVVAVGSIIAADMPASGLLNDVGVSEAGTTLILGVVWKAEEALGHSGWA